jgi:chromate transport protein ChrA
MWASMCASFVVLVCKYVGWLCVRVLCVCACVLCACHQHACCVVICVLVLEKYSNAVSEMLQSSFFVYIALSPPLVVPF